MAAVTIHDFKRLKDCLQDIANDPLAGDFIRDKARRALSGKPDGKPRDMSTYK